MPSHHLIEGAARRIWVFGNHVSRVSMCCKGIPALNEQRQVPQRAVFHNQVDVRCRFMAVDKSHNMRMMEAFEDIDLG